METKRGRFVYNEIFKILNLTLTYEIHVFNYKIHWIVVQHN